MANTSLIDALVKNATQYAHLIARVLWRAEKFQPTLKADADTASTIDFRDLARDLEAAIESESSFSAIYNLDKERLSLLILHAWLSVVQQSSNRRPDILALVCQALASPRRPDSYEVARFAVVLALRTLYHIPHSTNDIRSLKTAYEGIDDRVRRQTRPGSRRHPSRPHEAFIVDLLALESHVYRDIPRDQREAYYKSFTVFPFGVDASKARRLGDNPESWELQGDLPDFADIVNLTFCQPLGIAGLDEVTGGLLPAPADGGKRGGLVTLVTGEPGSGKTTLCLTIASRMAEMGSVVQYLATEESEGSLRAKLATAPGLSRSWPEVVFTTAEEELFDIVTGTDFPSLNTFVDQLDTDIRTATASDDEKGSFQNTSEDDSTLSLFPTFPRVLVIDSMTALLGIKEGEDVANQSDKRGALARSLQLLRENNVCVFLVGGPEDGRDKGLDFLVDNVVALGRESAGSPRHTVRLLTLLKTRLQASLRDQHVFHLGRQDGFSVSPSLHSTLQILRRRVQVQPHKWRRGVILAAPPETGREQFRSDDLDRPDEIIAIRSQSQCLVYGRGSAAKARFAISIAFEPKYPARDPDLWRAHVLKRRQGLPELDLDEINWVEESRVLIVSFLYDRQYYQAVVDEYFQKRFALAMRGKSSEEFLRRHLDVLAFYPSLIDPETLVAQVRRHLTSARLSGKPFSGVVLDGVHNILLQFPLLEGEHLLWPALYRLFRTEGVETVSTFTFFDYREISSDISNTDRESAGGQRLFFHLLVSGCDYSFKVQRALDKTDVPANVVSAKLVSTLDGVQGKPRDFAWDPETFQTASS